LYPVNVHEVDHTTGTSWARKEIAGAAIYREWTGEDDEEIHLRGVLFPHFYAKKAASKTGSKTGREASGLSDMDQLDSRRRLGQAHVLIRYDGVSHGWYVIERLTRGHSHLGQEGVGQRIQFEVTFQRVPVPTDPGLYYFNWNRVS
jgi:phage protein U